MVMYPEFVKLAQEERDQKALNAFCWALDAEKVHENLYREALASLDTAAGEQFNYYVCPVCGYTHERIAPDKCPICGARGEKFEKIS
jgi:rubrerythrin